MMALWLVRAGRRGERENLALEKNLAVIGWEELPDLSDIEDREKLYELLEETYPGEKRKTLLNWQSQIWPFVKEMQEDDLVALPLKSRSVIVLGKVTGPYEFRSDLPLNTKHTRPVKWLNQFSRSAFDQDLLYSLGASMTVCRIKRNNAEDRVRALLAGKPMAKSPTISSDDTGEWEAPPDLEQYARDQIRDYIARKFKGHELAQLVGDVLRAQGYKVQISPEGPDGGVDIFAGYGPMGFDSPRLVVQVKSGDAPVDVKVVRELKGVMESFGAERGLIVAWGGYKGSVPKEAARNFFKLRLWDADDLVNAVLDNYENLPDTLQAELPLKRIWTLVLDEEE